MATVHLDWAAIESIDMTHVFDRLGREIAADANANAHVITGRLSGRLNMGLLSGYHHVANPKYATIFTWVPYAAAEELGAVHAHWVQESHPHLRPALYKRRG